MVPAATFLPMMYLKTVRDALTSEIKSLASKKAKLEAVLAALDSGSTTKATKPDKASSVEPKAKKSGPKRIRLDNDTRTSMADKIVKAAKAHKDGASKADLIKYLKANGYEVGHHYNEPHLFQMLNVLRDGDAPKITTKGEKASMRYHAA